MFPAVNPPGKAGKPQYRLGQKHTNRYFSLFSSLSISTREILACQSKAQRFYGKWRAMEIYFPALFHFPMSFVLSFVWVFMIYPMLLETVRASHRSWPLGRVSNIRFLHKNGFYPRWKYSLREEIDPKNDPSGLEEDWRVKPRQKNTNFTSAWRSNAKIWRFYERSFPLKIANLELQSHVITWSFG